MTSITKSITSVTVTMDVRQEKSGPQPKTSDNNGNKESSKPGIDPEEPVLSTTAVSQETKMDIESGYGIQDNDRQNFGSSVDPADTSDNPATRSPDDQSNTPNDGRSTDSGADGGTGKEEAPTNLSKEVQAESDNAVAATADVIDRVEEEQCSLSIDEDRLSIEQKKQIADLRKFAAVELQEEVIKKLTEKIMTEKNLDDTYPYTVIYIQSCAKLCWLMCLHKPPVVIGFVEPTDDTRFEKDKYKEYTKTGKWLDFVVWPPLYLHEGGPMLSKGTAQGRKDKK